MHVFEVHGFPDSGLGSAVLHDIASELESGRPSHVNDGSKCFVAHLYPGDVPNVLTGMRSIISNLIAKEEIDTGEYKGNAFMRLLYSKI